MYEYLMLVFAFAMAYALVYLMPLIKHYRSYQFERHNLVKKYNRMYRSRKDLLVSIEE